MDCVSHVVICCVGSGRRKCFVGKCCAQMFRGQMLCANVSWANFSCANVLCANVPFNYVVQMSRPRKYTQRARHTRFDRFASLRNFVQFVQFCPILSNFVQFAPPARVRISTPPLTGRAVCDSCMVRAVPLWDLVLQSDPLHHVPIQVRPCAPPWMDRHITQGASYREGCLHTHAPPCGVRHLYCSAHSFRGGAPCSPCPLPPLSIWPIKRLFVGRPLYIAARR